MKKALPIFWNIVFIIYQPQMIYQPKGKAREYSEYALNYYSWCNHWCKYCYVPKLLWRFNSKYKHWEVTANFDKLKKIETSCKKYKWGQVLLSFTWDPYTPLEEEINFTTAVLEILCKYDVETAILTKWWSRCLKDLDLFKKFKKIKIWMTLTTDNNEDSKKWECNASFPQDRFETLEILHNEGITTRASLEPVLYPEQSLNIIDITNKYVDQYKVWKLNWYAQHEKKIDRRKFWETAIEKLRNYWNAFYVKNDLAKYITIEMTKQERDMDYLAVWTQTR